MAAALVAAAVPVAAAAHLLLDLVLHPATTAALVHHGLPMPVSLVLESFNRSLGKYKHNHFIQFY